MAKTGKETGLDIFRAAFASAGNAWSVILSGGSSTIGAVTSPANAVSSALTGQITGTTAGSAVAGPNVALANGVFIKAKEGNTGVVYVGNDGANDISSLNGFELGAGDLILVNVANLNNLYFDVASSGDAFTWMKA